MQLLLKSLLIMMKLSVSYPFRSTSPLKAIDTPNAGYSPLKGVGPRRASVLNQHDIYCIEDILRHYPRKYLDRTNIKKI